jgi:DNA-binding beta-propeller fold protein YncE
MGTRFDAGITMLLSFLFFSACVKDKPSTGKANNGHTQSPKLLVANEGAYGNGNASLSYIDLEKAEVNNYVYQNANGRPLGDVLQSLNIYRDKIYLIVNNSNKIVVLSKKDFKQSAEIAVSQPRYMCILDERRALVTSMYRGKIHLIDLERDEIIQTIDFPFANSEGMWRQGNSVFICPWDVNSQAIYRYDIPAAAIIDSISLGVKAPLQIVEDKNSKLWVLSGNPQRNIQAHLTQINSSDGAIVKQMAFPATAEVIKPVMNLTKDTLYFLGVNYNAQASEYNGVFGMSIEDNTVPVAPIIPAQHLQYFWSVGVNPKTGNLFVADPKGFIQSGQVMEYTTGGTLLNTYTVGLGPGYFLFE